MENVLNVGRSLIDNIMRILRDKLGRDRFRWILFICLILQFAFVAFCNFRLSEKNIDFDSAKCYVYAIELWRNKALFLSDWHYASTTLPIDCSVLFAAPLFGILGNIYSAFAISNVIFICIFVWTIFRIFRGKDILYSLLGANFILIPYEIGQCEYFNMMFFNYSAYNIKVLLPLMAIALLVNFDEEESRGRKRKLLFLVLYLIMLLITSFASGIYVFICGLFPVLAGYVIYHFYNHEKINSSFIIFAVLTVFSVSVGYILNLLYAGQESSEYAIKLCTIDELQQNIFACFWGIFQLLGGAVYTNVPVFSYTGINALARMGFVIVLLIGGGYIINQMIKHKITKLPFLLAIILPWNTFLQSLLNSSYGGSVFGYRYHLISVIPLICAVGYIIAEAYIKYNDQLGVKIALGTVCMAAFFFLIVTSYVQVLQKQTYGPDSNEVLICEYIEHSDIEKVYFLKYNAPAEVCRLLDYNSAVYLTVSENGYVWVNSYYKKYIGEEVQFDNAALIIWNGDGDLEEEMEMFGHDYKRIKMIGSYSVYQ